MFSNIQKVNVPYLAVKMLNKQSIDKENNFSMATPVLLVNVYKDNILYAWRSQRVAKVTHSVIHNESVQIYK